MIAVGCALVAIGVIALIIIGIVCLCNPNNMGIELIQGKHVWLTVLTSISAGILIAGLAANIPSIALRFLLKSRCISGN
jgi:hypothetical protein